MSRELVERAVKLLRANYIFPDKAERAADAIKARLDAGEYDGLDEEALGSRLTEQLFELCADKHLRVRPRRPELHDAMTREQARAVWLEHSRLNNYGVAKVERLDGNVGYLELREMTHPGAGGRAIAAAMELVSQSYALIIDLRRCGGGSPHGVIFWNSYLFPDCDTHLNDIYDGATGQTRQFWSAAYLPGERYLDRPVYVLTSGSTFSGAEEFSYNLKVQRRATLVGEITRGGAHPTDAFPITATFEITVPVARSVNPITGTNWEAPASNRTSPSPRTRHSASRTAPRSTTSWPPRRRQACWSRRTPHWPMSFTSTEVEVGRPQLPLVATLSPVRTQRVNRRR